MEVKLLLEHRNQSMMLVSIMLIFLGIILGFFASALLKKESPLQPPMAASQEIRNYIIKNQFPIPQEIPTTDEAWINLRERVNKARAGVVGSSLEALSSRFVVTVERDEILGVPIFRLTPESVNTEGLFIHLHGGGRFFGGGDLAAQEGIIIASKVGIEVISIDYRVPPENPHPAAIEDIARVYWALFTEEPNRKYAIGGTSAGGELALASIHYFKEMNYPIPDALYAGTPRTDATNMSDSLNVLKGIDPVLPTYDGFMDALARLNAGSSRLDDPLISPIFGEFDKFPPAYLVTGTRDLLLSDTVRLHRKLREAGIEASLNVYDGMFHGGYLIAGESPEFHQVHNELREFLVKQFTD